MRVLVAGVGNVLRADDAFGVEVARRLGERVLPDDVRVIETGIGGIALVQELTDGWDALVVIDAVDRDRPPGTVMLIEPDVIDVDALSWDERHDLLADMHLATPERALMLARALGVLPAHVLLVGCQPEDAAAVGRGLSHPVAEAVDVAVDEVLRHVGALAVPAGTSPAETRRDVPALVAEPLVPPREVIEELEARLAATRRGTRPYEHASLAYRLGLAYAEHPGGDVSQGLRRALGCYDAAAAIFDPRFDPVEHARVLNAAGAAHRALGNQRKAASLFERAASLLQGRGRDDERAAALNNLGLTHTDLGDRGAAIAAFDGALALFDAVTADGRLGRVAALHNRGLAHSSAGDEQALESALADFDRARSELDVAAGPHHTALLDHSTGVALNALAALRAVERQDLLTQAVEAFAEAITVFTRAEFPHHHGLAKHNLGVAWADLGRERSDPRCLRRALASFEDAAATLDPRLHRDAWRQVYQNLERVEAELRSSTPEATRATHFALLVGAADTEERSRLVRERLLRLLSLPEVPRRAAIGELALAIAQLAPAQARAVMVAELSVLMELPNDALAVVLRAHFDAHQRLPEPRRELANRALDETIGDALGAPQRIFVRDFLYSLGWERP
ncbi:MAG: hydrogenase maturation protease [Acidimicrobiales bacterium]